MKKVTSLLMALILSVTILMGSIPMNASAATVEVPVGWYQSGKKISQIVMFILQKAFFKYTLGRGIVFF